jgi:CheY-like chemotaxis protein
MERAPPLLVLLDLRMPGVSGEELLVQLRARPTLAEVPVVVLSGDADAARVAAALRADGWLPKPIEMSELLDVVRRFRDAAAPAPPPRP